MEVPPNESNELSDGPQPVIGETVMRLAERAEVMPKAEVKEQRRAVLPDLIGGQLSPKNAKWLKTQQDKAEKHRRDSAARLGNRGRAR